MNSATSELTQPNVRSLAATLAPQLLEACHQRLHGLAWFRTDWQRGGAATATAKFRTDDGVDHSVVVKVPVVQRELIWTRRLQPDAPADDAIVPRLFASGEEIAGYDLAWIVIERLPHGPLGVKWHDDHIPRVAHAAARFHAASASFPVDREARTEPWVEMLREAHASLKLNHVDEEKRWHHAVKKLQAVIDSLVAEWNHRESHAWVHGDLHFANAMCRSADPHAPVCLIDLAEVRPGHWIEDAVYLERLMWSHPEHMKAHKPVKTIAAARRALGLPVEDDYPRLAAIRRALLAGTAPRFIKSEGNPRHFHACLERLESSLGELK